MLACSIVGDPDTVKRGITALVDRTGADELMVVSEMHDFAKRLRSFEIIAEVVGGGGDGCRTAGGPVN